MFGVGCGAGGSGAGDGGGGGDVGVDVDGDVAFVVVLVVAAAADVSPQQQFLARTARRAGVDRGILGSCVRVAVDQGCKLKCRHESRSYIYITLSFLMCSAVVAPFPLRMHMYYSDTTRRTDISDRSPSRKSRSLPM